MPHASEHVFGIKQVGMCARLACLLAMLVGVRAPAMQAQPDRPVRVEALVSDDRLFTGQPAVYQIVVENAQDVAPPTIEAPPGLLIEYAGASSQPAPTMIVNGRRLDTGPDRYILQYRVTPTRAGAFVIPEQTVRVGAQEHRVGEVRLTASDPPEDSTALLEVALASERAYVGEPVDLTLTWLFVSDVQSVRFVTAGSRDGYDLLAAAGPPSGGAPGVRLAELQFDDQPVVCEVRTVIRGGREYRQVTARRTVVPTRPGRLEVGPFLAMAQVRTGERSVGLLMTEPILEPRVTRSPPAHLDVRALPVAGRPAGFTGLVGAFSIEAQATPTSVNVGDPIVLRVTVRGPGPMDRVQAPDLSRQTTIAGAFRVESQGLRAAQDQPTGARVFETTLRATSDTVAEIPPIELPYFDSRTGRYDVARSAPIPIEVRATRVVTAADAVGAAPSPSGPAENTGAASPGPLIIPGSPIGRSTAQGLLANTVDPGVLRDDRGGLRTLLAHPGWSLGVLAPPLAFIAAWAYRLTRGRALDQPARRRRATRTALARLRAVRGSDQPERIAGILRAYIAERLGVPPAGLTSTDVRSAWGRSADPLAELLDRADAARLHDRAGPSTDEAMNVLRRFAHDPPAPRARTPAIAGTFALGLALLYGPAPQSAQASSQPSAAYEPTSAAALTPQAIFREASDAFQEGVRAESRSPGAGAALFLRAAELYERCIDDHALHSAPLHANRASALLLAGDVGRAIAAFRRAEHLDPTYPPVQAGLAAARARVGPSPTPSVREEGRRVLLAWRGHVPRAWLMGIMIAGWCVLWGGLAGRTLGVPIGVRWIAVGVATILVSAAPLVLEEILDRTPQGVIIAQGVVGLDGPGLGVYRPTFDTALPAGVELLILERRAGWIHARLADGRQTWLPEEAVEPI